MILLVRVLMLLCLFQNIVINLILMYIIFIGDMIVQEHDAIELAADAINAGIYNDLGSGGCPNVRIIRKDGTSDFLYEYRKQNKVDDFRKQYQRPKTLDLPRGTTSSRFSLFVIFQPLFLKQLLLLNIKI